MPPPPPPSAGLIFAAHMRGSSAKRRMPNSYLTVLATTRDEAPRTLTELAVRGTVNTLITSAMFGTRVAHDAAISGASGGRDG